MGIVPILKRPVWIVAALVAMVVFTGVGARGSEEPAPRHPAPVVPSHTPAPAKLTAKEVNRAYGKLPLHFEANVGQAPRPAVFTARGQGYGLLLTPTEAVLGLIKSPTADRQHPTSAVLRMRLAGAYPKPRITGLEPLTGRSNYLIGQDQQGWKKDISTYGRVLYEGVYPGIDLVYYGNQRQLEYDFLVSPGADPRQIQMEFRGADRVRIDARGDLVVQLPGGEVRQHRPVVYQEVDGARKSIDGRFVLKGERDVAFQVAAYDASKPLVIDPVLRYSTYLGGSNDDYGVAIAQFPVTDPTNANFGVSFVTGYTGSFARAQTATPGNATPPYPAIPRLEPFPSTGGSRGVYTDDGNYSLMRDPDGPPELGSFMLDLDVQNGPETPFPFSYYDAFVTKMNAAGTALVYSTYLGGFFDDDYGMTIAADANGYAYVGGMTLTTTFPLVRAVQALSGDISGGFTTRLGDGFITKLSPAGNFDAQSFSTYLGGQGRDVVRGIAVDPSGNVVFTGLTGSTNFLANRPLQRPPFQPNYGGGSRDQFAGALNQSGASFNFLTFLGGSGDEGGAGPDTWLTPYNLTVGVHRLPADLTPPVRTFPGASLNIGSERFGNDYGAGIAVDSQGNSYITGGTNSPAQVIPPFTQTTPGNFPATPGAFQVAPGGGGDAFVVLFDTSGQLQAATFLGGGSDDAARAVALDPARNVYLTGYTASTNFPTQNPFQPGNGGGRDAFVTKMTADLSGQVYSTYLGGSGEDIGYSIAVSASTGNNAFVTGSTQSANFPRVNQIQSTLLGPQDAFVTKFLPTGAGVEYSTFLGGFSRDFGHGIAVDASGRLMSPAAPSTSGPLRPRGPRRSRAPSGHSSPWATFPRPTGGTMRRGSFPTDSLWAADYRTPAATRCPTRSSPRSATRRSRRRTSG